MRIELIVFKSKFQLIRCGNPEKPAPTTIIDLAFLPIEREGLTKVAAAARLVV